MFRILELKFIFNSLLFHIVTSSLNFNIKRHFKNTSITLLKNKMKKKQSSYTERCSLRTFENVKHAICKAPNKFIPKSGMLEFILGLQKLVLIFMLIK